jgi:hypothetical protein
MERALPIRELGNSHNHPWDLNLKELASELSLSPKPSALSPKLFAMSAPSDISLSDYDDDEPKNDTVVLKNWVVQVVGTCNLMYRRSGRRTRYLWPSMDYPRRNTSRFWQSNPKFVYHFNVGHSNLCVFK